MNSSNLNPIWWQPALHKNYFLVANKLITYKHPIWNFLRIIFDCQTLPRSTFWQRLRFDNSFEIKDNKYLDHFKLCFIILMSWYFLSLYVQKMDSRVSIIYTYLESCQTITNLHATFCNHFYNITRL